MNNYKITYYLNTACRERRSETLEDICNGWKVEEKEFNSDLEAYEYALKDCLRLDEEDIQDIYDDEEAESDIEKIEAIQNYFDNQDPSDGSILLIKIEGPDQVYDFGFEQPQEEFDENLSLQEVTMKKLLQEDEDEDDYDLHLAAEECIYEGFDFANKEFIDSDIIKNASDYIKQVRTNSEDYEDAFDGYLNLEDYSETEVLTELYKILTGVLPEDFEISTHIEVVDEEGECPYLVGYSNEDIDVSDRGDLDEDELWATGWSGIVQNAKEGPFKSFSELDISCFDDEKGGEYFLPDIPNDIQQELLNKVNKFVEWAKKEAPELLD